MQPVVLDPATAKVQDATETDGVLCIADSWPGQMRTLWGDHERFEEAYFSQYQGYYFTGDGCRRDADGYYWITGRVDDVINVSGHRMGTAEVEMRAGRASRRWPRAAVVGYPHDIKGQGIYAYVTLMNGVEPTEELRKELEAWVRTEIGPIAKPDLIQWAPGLPKTRSGKIMRRILRKIAENDFARPGRHLDPGRPGGGRRPDRQPHEPGLRPTSARRADRGRADSGAPAAGCETTAAMPAARAGGTPGPRGGARGRTGRVTLARGRNHAAGSADN